MAAERRHDIALFGATGFTGALTADYLAQHAPADTRLSLAGRNRDKLAALRGRLARASSAPAEMPLLHADVDDPASLREVAASGACRDHDGWPVYRVRRAARRGVRRGRH